MEPNKPLSLTIGLLLALVATTGCIVPGDAAMNAVTGLSADTADEPSAANHEEVMGNELEPVTLEACTEHSGVFTFPASQADPYLPDGFETTGVSGDPLPVGKAVLIAMLLRCQGPGVDEVSDQFLHLIVVEPPEAYANENAAIHYINVAGVTNSGLLRAAYETWGLGPVSLGQIHLDGSPGAPGLDAWATEASAGSDGATMTTTAVGNHPELSDGAVRIFGVGDGAVSGIADFQGTAWEGAVGEASYENDGLSPIDLDGPGVAYHAWGIDYVVTAAELAGYR